MKEKRRQRSRRVRAQIGRVVGWRIRLSAAIIALSACIAFEVYGRALHGPFAYDDFSLPFYKPGFPTEVFAAWVTGVRPILMLSYWLNYQLSGRNPFSYHLLSLMFHLMNSGLVFLLLRRILARALVDRPRVEMFALFGSALFLLHPIQTESVAYIAGRSEVLSAFFFLLAFTVFLYRPSTPIDWPRSLTVLLLFACAVATKEHTITLPFLLLLTDVFLLSERPMAVLRRDWRLYAPILCGAVVAAGLIGYEVNTSGSAGFNGAGVSWVTYFLTECRVLFVYLRLLLLPVSQNFDHDIPWAHGVFDWTTSISLLGILSLGAVAWILRRRFQVGCYGLMVFLLLLAPTSSFIPIKDAIAERRLYLPMLGFVLMVCECLLHFSRERKWVPGLAALLLVLASIATDQRNRVWASEAALWEDTLAKSPNKVRDYGHLVHGLVEEHRCHEALDRLSKISGRVKPDAALLAHWSFAYECAGDPWHALEKLQQSATLKPWPSTYVNMARHQLTLNRPQDAIQSLGRALALDPQLALAYRMRAGILESEGDFLAAVHDYEQALHLNPGDQQASFHLRRISALRQQRLYLSSP